MERFAEFVLYPLSSIRFARSLSESPFFSFPRISMATSLAVRSFLVRFFLAMRYFLVAGVAEDGQLVFREWLGEGAIIGLSNANRSRRPKCH